MLKIQEKLKQPLHSQQYAYTLTLPFESRQKSRQRTTLDDGTEIGLFLPRGSVLRGGDLLRSDNGAVILVQAAAESVSTVAAKDPQLLMKAAYHLGNRHVSLQIGVDWLRYQHDHVLDDMVKKLGLQVTVELATFEPESGAYHHGHHNHVHA